jgi:drug/metabolite transporter (DMT)-like permease
MPSLQASRGIAYLGVVASAAAYLVYNLALRELDASLVGVLSNLDPIVGVATSVVFLGESLNTGQMGGGALALLGMWLASAFSAEACRPSDRRSPAARDRRPQSDRPPGNRT